MRGVHVTYTAGVIGLSGIGAHHGNSYKAVDGIDIAAVADIDADLVAERGDQWDINPDRRYDNHAALLADEDLDAVSIATPTFLHRDHVLDAVESAADPDVIWCEKPIATSVTEAEEMVSATSEAGVELVINHPRRFGEFYRELRKQILEDNLLGDVRSVHITGPEELLRNGTHAIDLAYYLLDDSAAWGYGYLTGHTGSMDGGFDDSGGAGMYLTESGTYVNIDYTVPRQESTSTWLLIGTAGKLSFVDRKEYRYWRLEDSEEGSYRTKHIEAELPNPVSDFGDLESMLRNGADHVVDILDGNADNLSPGEEAMHALEIISALFVAHYTGASVELPLERPLRDVRIRSR